ncbi:DUF421 domain-containing protein [Alicyclobacillus dauci]|uniref:DUF421 domain-containing protein n=1 Tax=Alicyclobacillus dauci TaxID=1475485 RepID=A0ABY6Z6D0_9BACL|nr:DUF421 domain-containing protein [Alicyclobacillus dauci]WAH38430.1 DUF421 domain-containing protein [Alicyclobacillus dauci]
MVQVPDWQFPIRILVLYLLVMVALRVMGKREIGQLSVFDFVVSVMIAELSTLPMEDTQVPLYKSVISIGSLVLFQTIVAFLQIKSHRFRHFVDGEPSVLIEHGQVKDREMKRLRYSVHDLMTQLREKGVSNVADVEFAILETSGQLSVFPKAAVRPLTPRDIGRMVDTETIPMPLIVDGYPVEKTLSILKQDETWLADEMKRRGYSSLRDVFYASVDASGNIWIDERDARDEKDRHKGNGEDK